MDWGQAMRMLHNSRVMRAHEALGSMITGRSTGPLASIQHGLLGLDFASPYLSNYGDDDYCDDDYDEEDDDDDDNDEEDDDYYHSDRTWKDNSHSQLVPHPRIKQLTPEEAEKHAKDLLKEEERRKEKAEKKRQKKIRQKEKRRLEKLNADKDNELPDDKAQGQPTSENQGETVDTHYIRETNEPLVDGPGPIRTKTEVTSPEERNCGNVVVEEDGALARESEELDMNSSFISTAAAIAKKQFDQKRESKEKRKKKKKDHAQQSEEKDEKPKIQEEEKPEVQEEERPEVQEEEKPEVQEEERPEVQEPQQENMSNEDSVKRSTELANIGNRYAACGQLDVAVKYFTDAIKHNPKEYKLFGNRSFCYEKMQQYDKALIDADLALSMEPGWIKGLFRKGKALCGLKRYYEASITYDEVLKQDSSREDASQELMRVHIMQLMEMGFTWERSLEALNAHSTFEEAVYALSEMEGASARNVTTHPTEEEWIEVGLQPTSQNTTKIIPRAPITVQTRPKSNTRWPVNGVKPELFPVWVGSVVPAITETRLHTLFSRAGEVYSIKMLMEQQCAFVHYTRKEDCEKAIQLLNGVVKEGTCLAVRHPTKIHPEIGVSLSAVTAPINARPPAKVKKNCKYECYFWRTTGRCCKRDCTYIHISEHKGIDKAKTTHQ